MFNYFTSLVQHIINLVYPKPKPVYVPVGTTTQLEEGTYVRHNHQ